MTKARKSSALAHLVYQNTFEPHLGLTEGLESSLKEGYLKKKETMTVGSKCIVNIKGEKTAEKMHVLPHIYTFNACTVYK